MKTMNPSFPRGGRRQLLKLLGGALVILGGILLIAVGLFFYRQSVVARSSLNELREKVASIPVSEGEPTYLLPLPASSTARIPAPPSTLQIQALIAQPVGSIRPEASPEEVASGPVALVSLPEERSVSGSEGESQALPLTSGVTERPVTPASMQPLAPVMQPEAGKEVTSPALPTSLKVGEAVPLSGSGPASGRDAPSQSDHIIRLEAGQDVFSFTPVYNATLLPLGSLPPATRILIPAINLVSSVVPLELQNDKGQWSYNASKESVGLIRTAGNPGEVARGWYFGHIQVHPFYRDEAVFQRLPKVVDLISEGKTVDVILETEETAYLYQVTGRPIILTAYEFDSGYFHANLYAPKPEIVLTTCVPQGKSDHRLLVTAVLTGVGPLPQAGSVSPATLGE